jgi:hypothetical protein
MMQNFKISFYMNSQVRYVVLEAKDGRLFITVGVVMQRDDVREMAVKGNDGDE